LSWLELVAEGKSGRTVADIEGSYVDFLAFDAPEADRVRIVIAYSGWGQPDGKYRRVVLDIEIRRQRFIETFYRGFRRFAESPSYVAREWAFLSISEDLAMRGLKAGEEAFAHGDSATINQVLFRLYPRPTVYFPNESDQSAQLGRFVDFVLSKERNPPRDMIEVPGCDFNVPPAFDTWDLDKRRQHIRELFKEPVNSWRGCDLRKLKSSKLEAWLGT
jgi:hypothetical protein